MKERSKLRRLFEKGLLINFWSSRYAGTKTSTILKKKLMIMSQESLKELLRSLSHKLSRSILSQWIISFDLAYSSSDWNRQARKKTSVKEIIWSQRQFHVPTPKTTGMWILTRWKFSESGFKTGRSGRNLKKKEKLSWNSLFQKLQILSTVGYL